MLKRSILAFFIFTIILSTLPGCLPPPKVEKYEEIAPNETAFIVSLEGDTKEGQGKFMSVEFLEKAKVATKRIIIPQRARQIGRYSWNIEWIPTIKVIKVDRTPVTREWTTDPSTGTAAKDEGLNVESKDSINFWLGITITARITEENAATFLYNYSGKPLAEVVDENVRGYVLSVVSREFGKRNLDQCRTEKTDVFDIAYKETKTEFEKKGITIDVLGNSGGLNYADAKIQDSINKAFIAENQKLIATQEMEEQKIKNETTKSMAETKLYEAQKFQAASQAQESMIELEIEKIKAEAMKIAAEKWDGHTPSMVTPGSNFLFGLDEPVGEKK